jgi:hypothetical protein
VRRHLLVSCSQHAAAERLELESVLADPGLAPLRPALAAAAGELAAVRRARGGQKQYHTMVAAYFAGMARVLAELRRVCGPAARVCMVVGDSAPYGVHVPVPEWLGELALAAGFGSVRFEKTRDRNVKWRNRKHRVPLVEGRLWAAGDARGGRPCRGGR